MSEPVRVITQTESWRQEVQRDVIETLERLLEQAHSGELQGIAYAGVTADNCVVTGFSKDNGRSAIIGGLERVKHRMLTMEL